MPETDCERLQKGLLARRRMLQGTGAALAALGALAVSEKAAYAAESVYQGHTKRSQSMSDQATQTSPTIVLFHGAWADGSSWGKVISMLQEDGYTVVAPAVGLQSLSADIAAGRKVLNDLPGSLLVVGHSYGGAVITGAASGVPNVQGLVYLAGFVPDQGESIFGLVTQFAQQYGPAPAGQYFRPDGGFDNPQTLVYLDRTAFGTAFVQDIDPERAAVLAATQRPIAVQAFGEPLQDTPAWKRIRSWYQVSAQDRVIQPDAERWMAQRANAEIAEFEVSHASLVARPQAIARFIKQAARA